MNFILICGRLAIVYVLFAITSLSLAINLFRVGTPLNMWRLVFFLFEGERKLWIEFSKSLSCMKKKRQILVTPVK